MPVGGIAIETHLPSTHRPRKIGRLSRFGIVQKAPGFDLWIGVSFPPESVA